MLNRAERRRGNNAVNKATEEQVRKVSIHTTLTHTLAITLYVLTHEFNFKKKDVNKFITEYNKGFFHMSKGHIEIEEFIEDVLKNTGVDVREE